MLNLLRNWLMPLGYTETFRNDTDYHFIKDGIRVCCVLPTTWNDGYIYLSKDILNAKIPMSIRTGNYKLYYPEIEALHQDFAEYLST